ncbi:MAG: hypothetical protein IKT65_03310 [Clostridia bacterium]|nr:hypothetical protein [Clostridia bacterium]
MKCKDGIKLITLCAVCFGAGVVLALFLPPCVMMVIQSIAVCAVGILFILYGGRV